jgi:L-lactate dehydrogenase complex protein LldG
MIDTSASRRAVLSRICGPHAQSSPERTAEEYASITRAYDRVGSLSADELVDTFEERLIEYDAHVRRVTRSKLPEEVAAAIARRGAKRIAVPAGLPSDWIASSILVGIPVADADSLSNVELDGLDGLISGCTVAIALTGTIVLQNASAQGPRRLSLIPDYHLCVVFTEEIVETVPDAFDRLAATATLPTTFISGPSATADIEMTRIKGVHGPRFLEVLIVC